MVKKIVTIITVSIMLFSMSIVNAASGSTSFNTSATEVKQGETFTVTLSAKCEEGINGLETSYTYDESKLELISAKVANNNWSNLGEGNKIAIVSNTTIKEDNIYVLTFKARDNAEVGTTAKISTSVIKVYGDLSSANFEDDAKTVEIKINSNGIDNPNNNNNGNNNNNNNNNNGNNNNGNTNNGVNTNIPNTNNNGNQNTNIPSGYTGNLNSSTSTKNQGITGDNSTVLPKTGETRNLVVFLVAVTMATISSIVFYIKMRRQ